MNNNNNIQHVLIKYFCEIQNNVYNYILLNNNYIIKLFKIFINSKKVFTIINTCKN